MGARLSSDNSESPGSVSGVLAGGTSTSSSLRGDGYPPGNSASAGATPTRHPGSGSSSGHHVGAVGGAPSLPMGVPQGDSQVRLQRMLIRRQQQQYQSHSHSSHGGSSHGPRSSHPRSSRSAGAAFSRQRPRSYAGATTTSSSSGGVFLVAGAEGAQGTSSDDEDPDLLTFMQLRHYNPRLRGDVRCRMCNKMVPYDEHEVHYVMCLTKPRVAYNEDVLLEDKGECAICLEDMNHGDTIARLSCLCVYHKGCIDEWFKRSHTCPEHPGD